MWFPSPKLLKTVYYGAFVFSTVGIHFSPAMASIGVAGMIFSSVFIFSDQNQAGFKGWRLQIAAIMLLLLMGSIDIYNGTSIFDTWKSIQVMLPWFFLPLLISATRYMKFDPFKFLIILAIPLCWVSLASLINYASDFKFLSQMVLESKPLPLFTQVYHIEFSLLITVVLLGITYYFSELIQHQGKGFLIGIYVVLFLTLHIISARTGLLGYWLGMAIWGGYQVRNRGILLKIKPLQGLGVLVLALILVFQIPSLRNRVVNTKEDLNALFQGGDLNHKSIGQRVEAWRATLGIIEETKPLALGVGSHQFESELYRSYAKNNTTLYVSNWIGPHNQTLQWMATYGLIVVLLWYGLIITLLRSKLDTLGALMIGLPLWAASMFESIAQRQAGTLALIIGCVVFQVVFQARGNIKKISSIN